MPLSDLLRCSGERGLWGWPATLTSIVVIYRTSVTAAVFFGVIHTSWQDLEDSMLSENMLLPVYLSEKLTLTEISARSSDKSMIFHYDYNIPSVNEKVFSVDNAKLGALKYCSDFAEVLGNPVERMIYIYNANDGSKVEFEILPSDCDFE